MKKASIKTAILAPALAVLIVGVIIMVSITGVLSLKSNNELTGNLLEARVNEYANEFLVFNQDVYGALKATLPIVESYSEDQFDREVADPRGEVVNLLSRILMSNSRLIGTWTCWEPDAFDGRDSAYADADYHDSTGRFAPYVYRSGDGYRVEALQDYDDPIAGEYYQGPKTTRKPYITDPYKYDVADAEIMIYSLAMPVFRNGAVVGIVGLDVDLGDILPVMNSGNIMNDGYIFILSPGGLITTDPDTSVLLSHYSTTWLDSFRTRIEAVQAKGGSFQDVGPEADTGKNAVLLGTGVQIGDTGRRWVVGGVVPEKTVRASVNTLVWTIIAIGLVLIAVMSLTIYVIVKRRLKELPVLTATAEKMAKGEMEMTNLPGEPDDTKNEIVALQKAFSGMARSVMEQSKVLTGISRGDYSVSIPIRSDKDTINAAINHMLDSTNEILARINESAGEVSAGSIQIAEGAQALAQGSTEQASAIELLSVSIEDIASMTNQNAAIAKEAADLSDIIRDKAEAGNTQMERMMQAITDINDASGQISKVNKLIDDIAFQTKILALNAAVEAARAGQYGRGFAVVAEEVRNLAAKSAEAARDTGALIENSINKANLGHDIAVATARSLREIVEETQRSAEIVARIARASGEQSAAIEQVNTGVNQVNLVVQQNSATAEESAAAAEEMSGQANMLADIIARFKLRDDETQVKPLHPRDDIKSNPRDNHKYAPPEDIESDDWEDYKSA